jgi:curved DNA-binding protein CbpA
MKDYYEVFGIHRDATNALIKDAYRYLKLRYVLSASQSPFRISEDLVALEKANRVLSNPELRKQYDEEYDLRSARFSAGLDGNSQGPSKKRDDRGARGHRTAGSSKTKRKSKGKQTGKLIDNKRKFLDEVRRKCFGYQNRNIPRMNFHPISQADFEKFYEEVGSELRSLSKRSVSSDLVRRFERLYLYGIDGVAGKHTGPIPELEKKYKDILFDYEEEYSIEPNAFAEMFERFINSPDYFDVSDKIFSSLVGCYRNVQLAYGGRKAPVVSLASDRQVREIRHLCNLFKFDGITSRYTFINDIGIVIGGRALANFYKDDGREAVVEAIFRGVQFALADHGNLIDEVQRLFEGRYQSLVQPIPRQEQNWSPSHGEVDLESDSQSESYEESTSTARSELIPTQVARQALDRLASESMERLRRRQTPRRVPIFWLPFRPRPR